jgi:hypothetical protein
MVGRSRDGVLKVFAYPFVNKMTTRVYIRQVVGSFKAFAKILAD